MGHTLESPYVYRDQSDRLSDALKDAYKRWDYKAAASVEGLPEVLREGAQKVYDGELAWLVDRCPRRRIQEVSSKEEGSIMNMQSWQHTSSPLASGLRASLLKLKRLDGEFKKAKGRKRQILFDRMKEIVDAENRRAGETYGVPWGGFNGKAEVAKRIK